MSKQSSDILQLNFAEYSIQELVSEHKPGTGWKDEIFAFLEDWASNRKTITAQTSGSTGKPKRVYLEKGHMLSSAKSTMDFFQLQKGDAALLCLPVSFIAGMMMIVRAIERKLKLICIEPSLYPVLYINKIRFAAMTPAQLIELINNPEGEDFINKIEEIILGGSSVSEDLEQKLQSAKARLWHTYGMTETITHVALRKINGELASPWFQALEGVTVSEGVNHCLQIHAPRIGVENLLTNDLVEFSPQGFRIVGRKDNVLISGGVKIFPEQIERKLDSFLDTPFYLCGIDHEQFGQVLGMVVQKTSKFSCEDDILAILEANLNGLEIPKRFKFIEEIKCSANGKMIRKW